MKSGTTMMPNPSQERVGVNADKENVPPCVNKRHKEDPPIMMVHDRRWSPSIYHNAQLAGLGTNWTWVEAFVQ